MRWYIRLLIPLITVITLLFATTAISEAGQPFYNVGYKVLDLKLTSKGEERIITTAVWYPTSSKASEYIYGGSTTGNVAEDAPPITGAGRFPLFVFSHGYGGGGIAAVFFTEHLAARGWIVAAPDHHDRHSAVRIRTGLAKEFNRLGFLKHAKEISSSGPEDRGKYLYRLDEIQDVLDGVIASPEFGGLIDENRVAVGGHSFGGYTALGICGTIPERQDKRIKALLLFSTGAGGYLYRKEELQGVKIPSMLIMGEKESEQPRGDKTMLEVSQKIYNNVSPPKYFLEIRGGTHFSFNNRFSDTRLAKKLSGTEKQFDVIRRYSIAFMEKYVAGQDDAPKTLDQSDPMLTRFEKSLER